VPALRKGAHEGCHYSVARLAKSHGGAAFHSCLLPFAF
jgi:hypothetical protein